MSKLEYVRVSVAITDVSQIASTIAAIADLQSQLRVERIDLNIDVRPNASTPNPVDQGKLDALSTKIKATTDVVEEFDSNTTKGP